MTGWPSDRVAAPRLVRARRLPVAEPLGSGSRTEALAGRARRRHARFVAMQEHDNLLAGEEEREMIPLCLDEGGGTIIWSPVAHGRLARPWAAAKSTAGGDRRVLRGPALLPAHGRQ